MPDFEDEIRDSIEMIENNLCNVMPRKNREKIGNRLDHIDDCIERVIELDRLSEPMKNGIRWRQRQRTILACEIRGFFGKIREIYESREGDDSVLSDDRLDNIVALLECVRERMAEFEACLEVMSWYLSGSCRDM